MEVTGEIGRYIGRGSALIIPTVVAFQMGDSLANAANHEPSLSLSLKTAYALSGLVVGQRCEEALGNMGFDVGSGLAMLVDDSVKLMLNCFDSMADMGSRWKKKTYTTSLI